MARPDLNLLITLDVLLTEGSVTRAARKLQLSPSAMSRSLARLRETIGDPLLVRAGRTLVPTPRAVELRDEVRQLVQDVEAALRPAKLLDLQRLKRTFAIRASDGFAESFGPDLLEQIRREAPGVRLRLVRKLDKDSGPLREGVIDFETAVVGKDTSPELRSHALFRDHFVGVVRMGHELSSGRVDSADYARQVHVAVVRQAGGGSVEPSLSNAGVERNVVAEVDGYSAACSLVRRTNLVATIPNRHTAGLREGLRAFKLPFETPELLISLLWHPRHDGDPAHRWMRERIQDVCNSLRRD
jgi:DNA-binding transcriptional LysR family regulator